MIPDARDVKIPEDLLDPLLTVMVHAISRAHTPEKRSWLTYQNEIDIGVEIIEQTAKRVTESLVELGHTDCCKVAFATDASTAKSMMQGSNYLQGASGDELAEALGSNSGPCNFVRMFIGVRDGALQLYEVQVGMLRPRSPF